MKSKKSPEHGVRIKIGLIFLVIILFFTGLLIYFLSLKKNINIQKAEMDNSYSILSRSNQLIVSIQQAQDLQNMYLATPQRALQQRYDSIASDISLQIVDLKKIKPEKEQAMLLQEIDSLLMEKNRIVRKLTRLFRSQNPLSELDQKINRYDDLVRDSVVVTTHVDTIRVEKKKKNFWNRLKSVFNPEHSPDSTVNITRTEQESRSESRPDTILYDDLKNITEEASRSFSFQIQGIEREVRELLFAEQTIAHHISRLTNEFYNETIRIAWKGNEKSEELTRRIFSFAVIVGALSIFFILIIILLIIDDLNKGQKARTELVKEKKFTEELIESRHKLLLSVSHDIKTPLSSIMGYMEMWDSEVTGEDKKRQLQSARNSGRHILNMLTNLLEFSRLQQKSETVNYSRFNLIELTEEIVRMFHPFTEEKALHLQFENLAPAPLYMETDYTLLRQILTNVVSNAVKYTLHGGISIRVQKEDQPFVAITVTDTGIGMSADELPEIFKPFSRMQSPLKTEGSGFGMYVTKGLVDLLKGKIEVTSEKGKGSRVTILLPYIKIYGDDKPTLPDSNDDVPLKEVQFNKILIFEDDLPLGIMIREFLVRHGYEVELCNDTGKVTEFLGMISQFDIVFTDMHMKEITGIDILHEIRKRDTRIPVWLMTAYDDYTTRKAALEGFTGYIAKPIQLQHLLSIISEKNMLRSDVSDKEGAVSHKEDPVNEVREKEINAYRDKFPQLVSFFGEDAQTIREILSGFVQSSHQDMKHLQEYIENGSFEEAQQLCHKIYPFLCQLDAAHLCATLRKMDLLRGEDETSYPGWKEDLSGSIGELKKFTDTIEEEFL